MPEEIINDQAVVIEFVVDVVLVVQDGVDGYYVLYF